MAMAMSEHDVHDALETTTQLLITSATPSKQYKKRRFVSKMHHSPVHANRHKNFYSNISSVTFVSILLFICVTVVSYLFRGNRDMPFHNVTRGQHPINTSSSSSSSSSSHHIIVNEQSTRIIQGHDENASAKRQSALHLDFLMAGFAKTGSTSLLHLFKNHNETNVLESEMCTLSTDENMEEVSYSLDNISIKSPTMLRGIKCPTAMWNANGLSKLHENNPDLKIIIGLRHPISWFQSFYNYRVTEMHNNNMVIDPPSPQTLISTKDAWKGVSSGGSRFDIALMQLGKVELTSKDLTLLGQSNRRVIPSKFKIFIYVIDEISHQDGQESSQFKRDLQQFLGLKERINDIPMSNKNHNTGENKYSETMNICQPEYNQLRLDLMRNGKIASRWIRSKFMNHEDVTVGGTESNFSAFLEKWNKDPCSMNKRKMKRGMVKKVT
jgi:hypothetical protein